ncbi:hypothetical protein [Maricaulis sp.]|uniref:hypothetical protein n=1 Tax=Maricaulis sp. TaxID=1486257 RepID=UPI00261F3DF0|nr:hypothetical protein [Maricaulis sp.]
MLNRVRVVLTAMLATALAGCFYSYQPLITAESGVQPIPPGSYRAYSVDERGEATDDDNWAGDVVYLDGRLHSATDDMPLQDAVFHEMSRDIFIAVSEDVDDGDQRIYVIVFRYPGHRLFAHFPECDDLSAEAVQQAGLDRDQRGNCEVTSLDQLEQALTLYVQENEGLILDGAVLEPAN